MTRPGAGVDPDRTRESIYNPQRYFRNALILQNNKQESYIFVRPSEMHLYLWL
jgi:hypothetical protein